MASVHYDSLRDSYTVAMTLEWEGAQYLIATTYLAPGLDWSDGPLHAMRIAHVDPTKDDGEDWPPTLLAKAMRALDDYYYQWRHEQLD